VSRPQIIALSVVCCAFGLLALKGPHDYRTAAYVVNVALAIVCFVVAGRDLTRRGWQLGYLFAGSYILPLIGLGVYIGLSNRPVREPVGT
jgi:uncharacterized membrane protein YhhN